MYAVWAEKENSGNTEIKERSEKSEKGQGSGVEWNAKGRERAKEGVRSIIKCYRAGK